MTLYVASRKIDAGKGSTVLLMTWASGLDTANAEKEIGWQWPSLEDGKVSYSMCNM